MAMRTERGSPRRQIQSIYRAPFALHTRRLSLGLFKGHRARAREKWIRDIGAHPDVATLGAIALHPFVSGSPRPQHAEFRKSVRSDSYRFAREVRSVRSNKDLHDLARPLVKRWVEAASLLGEQHYRDEFLPVLNDALRAAEPGAASPDRPAKSVAELMKEDDELRAAFEAMDARIAESLNDPREMERPSRKLAQARMDAAAAAGVPEEDILQGEQALAQLEAMILRLTPQERRAWLGTLHPDARALGLVAIESIEADEEAGYTA
jgi:hypothetical protein